MNLMDNMGCGKNSAKEVGCTWSWVEQVVVVLSRLACRMDTARLGIVHTGKLNDNEKMIENCFLSE